MKWKFSQHAQTVVKEREILEEWIEHVLSHPEKREQDHWDPELEHCLGRIVQAGNRVLRVIVNKESAPWRVVTAYFDRKMRDKL